LKRNEFANRVSHEILILDGAMGTMLQKYDHGQSCVEMINLEHPDLMKEIHLAYLEAGADIITTNTFGGSRVKLAAHGMQDRTVEINRTAAALVKSIAGRALVAGSIGPSGKLISPIGDLSVDEAYAAFKEQAMALAEGGADLFLLETFGDLKELKLAIRAVRENTDLPVMAAMTFEENFLSYTGTDPETVINVITSLGADAVGVNCSTGPAPMQEIVGRYSQLTTRPIFVEPNAGLPQLDETGTSFQVSPEEMAEYAVKFVQLGANIVGSCCGSTPEFTRAIRDAIKDMKPVSRTVDTPLRLSSRTCSVAIGQGLPFGIIGERINPTNRDELAEALRQRQMGLIIEDAACQIKEGAGLLDINVGIPDIDEPAVMAAVFEAVEGSVNQPLVIDSTNPAAIEAVLKNCAGKPLINSVHGSKESLEAVLPLAARYGAGLLCLAVGEKGIPKTAAGRLKVLEEIIEQAEKAGVPRENLICDCLTLTVSAEQKRADSTLEATRLVRERLNLPTVLGVSNISFGLPERSLINSVFLGMAMGAGLDAAIINSGDKRMMEAVRAASVLTVRDRDSRMFVKSHQKKKKKKKKSSGKIRPESSSKPKIFKAVISGNRSDVTGLVEAALSEGISPAHINDEMLIPAIREVGLLYDNKEIYLPQMILAAETMQLAFGVLEPLFKSGETAGAGKVVLCTVKGDVHDIGKNIVSLFLKNNGFTVSDLGKDVDAETIVQQALEQDADVVALSALMTTTMVEMEKIIDKLKSAGSSARVVVGGAVVTKRFAQNIGAAGYAKDGPAAVKMIKELVEIR